MARYKPYSYAQGKFVPIHFANQILPGTFEYTLNYLVDHELDLSIFNDRYNNDDSGNFLSCMATKTPSNQKILKKRKIDYIGEVLVKAP